MILHPDEIQKQQFMRDILDITARLPKPFRRLVVRPFDQVMHELKEPFKNDPENTYFYIKNFISEIVDEILGSIKEYNSERNEP